MKKLGVLVGENQWTFFREIYEDFARRYDTQVFSPRTVHLPIGANAFNARLFAHDLRRLLRTSDVCFFEWASGLLMHASGLPKSCAIVTRLHSFELFEWAPTINWAAVDRVILVSEAMRARFAQLYPDHAHKTVVIYNGRPLDAFRPGHEKPFQFNLGMACSIVPIKRVYEAILVLHQLRGEGHDARLSIAGTRTSDLRYSAAATRLVELLNLNDHVTFHGNVDDMPSWFRTIDIFLSHSFWEGQQVALLEAMASGCYCLSHHWAGAEEMLPPDNLYLTDAELKRKIVEYATLSPHSRRDLRTRLRDRAVERFDILKTIASISEVVDQAVSAGTPHGS